MRLHNKVAVITGSRQGLGFEIAKRFLEEGSAVVLNGRNQNLIDESVSTLHRSGYKKVVGIEADISKRANTFRLLEMAVKRFGKVDILVNNAVDSEFGDSEKISEERWLDVINVNLSGAFYCSQAAMELSMKNHGGSIINITSMLGVRGLDKRAAYCASKHGLVGLTRALAVEWGQFNIRVNALCPSYILTPLEIADSKSGHLGYSMDDVIKKMPLKRYSEPEEQANACLWLASDESSFTTGSVLMSDGGWTAYGGV